MVKTIVIYNKETVKQILKDSKIPQSIDSIRFQAKIRSWGTARALLLEMLASGEVSGMKTSRGWIFWGLDKK